MKKERLFLGLNSIVFTGAKGSRKVTRCRACFKGVIRAFQGYLEGVSSKLYGCFKSEFNDCEQDITAKKKTTGYITVNGINMMELQKLRKTSDIKTTGKKKSTTPQRRKKKNDMPTPSSASIKIYLVRKKVSGCVDEGVSDKETEKTNIQEDIADNSEELRRKTVTRPTISAVPMEKEEKKDLKKMTFGTVGVKKKKTIKENIRMFQEFVNGSECVTGSGMCSTHNVRLVFGPVWSFIALYGMVP